MQFHHVHYSGDHVVSTHYLDNGDNNTLFFLTPVAVIERLHIRAALGRILAEGVISPLDVPSHDNSAMDGYAVRFADLKNDGEVTLNVAGTAFAGVPFQGLWLDAAPLLLEERVSRRVRNVSDATPAVVRLQLAFDLGTIDWSRLDSSGPGANTLAAASRLLGVGNLPTSVESFNPTIGRS